MYTKEELIDLSAGNIRSLAESIGVEYTTKTPTIEAILDAQNGVVKAPVLDLTPVGTPAVNETLVESAPVETPVVTPAVTQVSYYQKIGLPVGNDGNKIRYRLDGSRIN